MVAQFPDLAPRHCAPLFTGIAGPLTVINQPSVLTLSDNLKVTFEFVEVRIGLDGLKPEWTCGREAAGHWQEIREVLDACRRDQGD